MKESYNFDLVSFNRELRYRLNQVTKEKDVNNMELFVMNDDAKVSVTLEANYEMQESYHGLSPKFDDAKLKDFLFRNDDTNKCIINDQEEFWKRVKEEQRKEEYMNLLIKNSWTSINKTNPKIGSSRYLSSDEMIFTLLGRAILQMGTHFGFSINVPKFSLISFMNSLKESFSGIMEFPENVNKDDYKKNLYWQFNENYSVIHIKGIWPISVIEKLTKWFDYQRNTLIHGSSSSSGKNELYHLLTFNDRYVNKYQNSVDNVYYSGVMPKVLRIRYEDMPIAASKMKFIVFEVARTTFATIDMFDNPEIITHPFFHSKIKEHIYYDLMVNFDNHEDAIQHEFLYKPDYKEEKNAKQESEVDITNNNRISLSPTTKIQRDYEKWMINNLNRYLAISLNTNTVAVSANIVTKDDYLIIGKRGKLTIDNDQYYCSVNGQSEFRDSNVSFYRNSVFEDLPSMEYDSKYRIDMNNEIQRESLAELGLPFFEREWSYYGISYLSINNTASLEKKESIKNRRMHFNVLTHNSTSYSFEDVYKSQKKATESFENERLRGIKVKVHPDIVTRVSSFVGTAIKLFIKYKSNIFILYFIITLFFSTGGISNFGNAIESLSSTELVGIERDKIMNIGINNVIEIFIFLFFVVTSSIEIIRYKPVKKLLVTKNFLIKFHRDEYIGKNYNIKWKRIHEIITEKNLLNGIARKSAKWIIRKYERSLLSIITDTVKKILIGILSSPQKYQVENNQVIMKIRKGILKSVSSISETLNRNEISRVHGIVYLMYSLHYYEKVKTMKNPCSWLEVKRFISTFMKEVLSILLHYGIIVMILIYFTIMIFNQYKH